MTGPVRLLVVGPVTRDLTLSVGALPPSRARTSVLLSTALPAPVVESAADGARRAGATVVADLAGDPETAAAILDRVDVARGEAEEISELVGAPVRGFASATAAARRLLARGPSTVIVQAGEQGNVVLTGERELHVSQALLELVDPTGGGDAFIAAFAVAHGRGQSLSAASRLAAAAAGHAVSQLGGRPTFRDAAEHSSSAGTTVRVQIRRGQHTPLSRQTTVADQRR